MFTEPLIISNFFGDASRSYFKFSIANSICFVESSSLVVRLVDRSLFYFSAEPNFEDGAQYSVKVKVGDDWLNDDEPKTFCGGKCIFKVCNL